MNSSTPPTNPGTLNLNSATINTLKVNNLIADILEPVGPDGSIQYVNGDFLNGSGNFLFDDSVDPTIHLGLEEDTGIIKGYDSITTNADGGNLKVLAGNSNGTGTGGNVEIISGIGDNGGYIKLYAGMGNDIGGQFFIRSGHGGGSGGQLCLESGNGTTNVMSDGIGGQIDLLSGHGIGSDSEGGTITIKSGNGVSYGGSINITAGSGVSNGTIDIRTIDDGPIKLGQSSNLIGFFGSNPVSKQTASSASGYTAVGGTNVNSDDTFTGGLGSTAYTIGDLVYILKRYGLILT